MLSEPELSRAADVIVRSRLEGSLLGTLASTCAPQDEAQAYQLQQLANQRLTRAGLGEVAGYKIGCTTPVMQAYLGIDQPCAGEVFAATVAHRSARIPAPPQGRLGVECELAVQLSQSLGAETAPHDQDSVRGAIFALMPAIEVVMDRYQSYLTLGAETLIADNFFNVGVVLGEPCLSWQRLDLANLCGRLSINRVVTASGRGADVLEHPLAALAWLANRYAALGRRLRAGQFVCLGSLTQTQWVSRGDRAAIEIDGLGKVSLSVS